MRDDVMPVLARRLATAAGAATLIGACLGAAPAWAQTSQTFTQDGTFTVPAGVTQLTVTAVGGGAAGAGTASGRASPPGAAEAGAAARSCSACCR